MSPTKKRKLNGSSDLPPLSAFAARKSLPSSGAQSPHDSLVSVPVSTTKGTSQNSSREDSVALSSRSPVPALQLLAAEKVEEVPEDDTDSFFQSRDDSPEVLLLETPSVTLSTFKPSKSNVRETEDGTLCLRIVPGERLVILGQCYISVEEGQITLLGATILPSESKHRFFVPSSHSLPVIRCLETDLDWAEIRLYQCETGLGKLKSLSPVFDRLWNDGSAPLGHENKALSNLEKSSFRILFSSDDGPKGAYLQPIISAPEWNEALSKLSVPLVQKAPCILVCGPKSSGKSTFTKILSNRLLSTAAQGTRMSSTKWQSPSGVAVLDLDPGQPEYAVPGQLSLLHIREPNFGPPFTHPIPEGKSRLIRAHSIAAITPSMDPSLYMACALDLYAHYRNMLSTNPYCPLIINTPGWVLGTGLEILVDLISKIRTTHVVYMSQEGPREVVESLRDAAKTTPLFILPSQISKYVTKTAAHLRTMQAMSYFHIDPMKKNSLVWKDQPLSCVPPWDIRYSGENAGILGIMCYGEQPLPDLLLESINGSFLAVVLIEDMAAIPGWQVEKDEVDEGISPQSNIPLDSQNTELRALDNESLHPQRLTKPLIVRTPKEDIPYFNPANAVYLDPRHSHCIGLALVRGIDIPRRRLQIITPISPDAIAEINDTGKSIVLVSGKFDTPGWAYTEELMQRHALEKAAKTEKGDDVEEESDADEFGQEGGSLEQGFQHAPWVEMREGSQGRAIGSRVWRVRRDLGKSGE